MSERFDNIIRAIEISFVALWAIYFAAFEITGSGASPWGIFNAILTMGIAGFIAKRIWCAKGGAR